MLCNMCMHGISQEKLRTCTLCGQNNCPHCKCTHSIEEIKASLPKVKVVAPGKCPRDKRTEYGLCQIVGRKEQFAIVQVVIASYEFSWETVQRAINSGTALLI